MFIHRMTAIPLCAACLAMLLAGGCYVSPFCIGTAEQATVDRRFVGDWKAEGLKLLIRNFNDREYYVEWEDQRSTTRLAGFVTSVGNAQFANLRGLSDDGSMEAEFLLLRVQLQDDQLTLRHLRESFFADKSIESAEQLRKVVQENLENEQMYDEEVVLTRETQ